MQSMSTNYEIDKQPFIMVNNETVIDLSQSFADMTGFCIHEFLNRNIVDIFKLLRVGPDIDIENISNEAHYFLFTKSLEVKFVNIKVMNLGKEKAYILLEKPNSNLDVRSPFVNGLMPDNYYEIGIYRNIVEVQAKIIKKQNEQLKSQADIYMKMERELKQHQEIASKAECEKSEALLKVIEMKDEFLSLISHEFRTPLSVISTAIQAMNSVCGNELSDKSKKYLDVIRMNTFRQLRLVNNLLDITRADAGRVKINKKNVDIVLLTKSITESVNNYASQKGINIKFISPLEKKIIGIDNEKYERILLNLLSNAIKFTPESKSINVKLFSKKKSICVEVKDKGIGIPRDKVEVIFEKFGQVDSSLSRQTEGTGIGLALVKKYVEVLGGSISVKSKVGTGSTFTVLLPGEMIVEEQTGKETVDLLDNRLIQATKVEFSDIYL
jgi:signal transduction histidine kinase